MYYVLRNLTSYLYAFSAINRAAVDPFQTDFCSNLSTHDVFSPNFSVMDIELPVSDEYFSPFPQPQAEDSFEFVQSPTIPLLTEPHSHSCQPLNEFETELNENFVGFVCNSEENTLDDIDIIIYAENHNRHDAIMKYYKYIDAHSREGDILLLEDLHALAEYPCDEQAGFPGHLRCMGWDYGPKDDSIMTRRLALHRFYKFLLKHKNLDRGQLTNILEKKMQLISAWLDYYKKMKENDVKISFTLVTKEYPRILNHIVASKQPLVLEEKGYYEKLLEFISSPNNRDKNIGDFVRNFECPLSVGDEFVRYFEQSHYSSPYFNTTFINHRVVEGNRHLLQMIKMMRLCHSEGRLFIRAGIGHLIPVKHDENGRPLPVLITDRYEEDDSVAELRHALEAFPHIILVEKGAPKYRYT